MVAFLGNRHHEKLLHGGVIGGGNSFGGLFPLRKRIAWLLPLVKTLAVAILAVNSP
jgi:hypothetical protein